MNDLVGRWWRNVNTGTKVRHEQKFRHVGAFKLQWQDEARNLDSLAIILADGRSRIERYLCFFLELLISVIR